MPTSKGLIRAGSFFLVLLLAAFAGQTQGSATPKASTVSPNVSTEIPDSEVRWQSVPIDIERFDGAIVTLKTNGLGSASSSTYAPSGLTIQGLGVNKPVLSTSEMDPGLDTVAPEPAGSQSGTVTFTAGFDPSGPDDTYFGKYLRGIELENTFTVDVDVPGLVVDRVSWYLGQIFQGHLQEVTTNEKYQFTTDVGNIDGKTTVGYAVWGTLSGNDYFNSVDYTIEAITQPSWISNTFIPITIAFKVLTGQYEGQTTHSLFDWGWEPPSDIPFVGGLSTDTKIEIGLSASYDGQTATFTGSVDAPELKILGHEGELEGDISGSFDSNFNFEGAEADLSATIPVADLPSKELNYTITILKHELGLKIEIGGTVDITVAGSVNLDQNWKIESLSIAPGIAIDGELSISLDLGVLNGSGSAKPSISLTIEIDYNSGDGLGGKVTLSAEIDAEGKVCLWKFCASFGHTFGPYGVHITINEDGSSAVMLTPLQHEGPPVDVTEQVLAEILSSSSVATVDAGKRMVVWIGDLDPEPGIHDAEVFYRYFDGANWSDAAVIDDTGNDLWENDPAVVFMADGQAMAAWTSNDLDPDADPDLTEALAAQDILYSIWDGASWSEPGSIIDDEEGDGLVRLAYDSSGDRVVAAWVHDADTDQNVNTTTDRKILYSIWKSGAWSQPQAVPTTDQGAADYQPAVASDDQGNTYLLWVNDGDGEFYGTLPDFVNGTNVDLTNSDSNVFWSVLSGGGWAAPSILTAQDDWSDVNPALAAGPNGGVLALWVEDHPGNDILWYSRHDPDTGQWSAEQMVASQNFIQNPKVVVGPSGLATVVWVGFDGIDNELFSSTLAPNADSWADPQQITHDGVRDSTISLGVEATGQVLQTWSKEDQTASGDHTTAGFTNGINLGLVNSDAADLTGNYTDAGTDVNGDGVFETLMVTVETDIKETGDYTVRADLFGAPDEFGEFARLIAEASDSATDLPVGIHTFELTFPANLIGDSTLFDEEMYGLRNVVLLYGNTSLLLTDFAAAPYETASYQKDQFPLGVIYFEHRQYKGTTQDAKIILDDQDLNLDSGVVETVDVPVISSSDRQGITVSLTETGPDTGVFEGFVGFNVFGTNDALDEIFVTDGAFVETVYNDGNPLYVWRDGTFWQAPMPFGDVDADGEVDGEDLTAIAALLGTSANDPSYSPAADVDDSGTIDLFDLVETAVDFGARD